MQTVLRKKDNPAYTSWHGLRQRCNNSNDKDYARYGGRGIKVCDRWDSFFVFLADMGERPSSQHSVDRIDNDGDYTPENCRWATKKEQTHNSRVVKLDIEKVQEIRSKYLRGIVKQTDIGKLYGIDQSVVSRIINGKIW